MQAVFHGSATALVTPFRSGKVDFAALERLIERQIEGGTQALVILGTTGEPSTMTQEEKEAVLAASCRTIRGRVPLIAGTGSNDTASVIAQTRRAAELGADAALIVTPYYNKTTQRGLYLHYEKIDEATALPYIVYNVPGRTGLNLAPKTMEAIASLHHVAGLKDASSSLTQGLETMRLCPNLPLYCGADELNFPYLACGAAGTISVVSNILPESLRRLWDLTQSGDYAAALALHQELAPLTSALFAQTSPIPSKAALKYMGLCEEEVRAPLFPLEDGEKAALYAVLEKFF